MNLKSNEGSLEIEVRNRISSDSDDYWDGNWLYVFIKGVFPGFQVNFGCNIRTDELQNWYEELQKLSFQKVTQVQLVALEEGITLLFEREATYGTIKVSGKLTAVDLTGCSLEFVIIIDNYEVMNFILELGYILEKYPIVGKLD